MIIVGDLNVNFLKNDNDCRLPVLLNLMIYQFITLKVLPTDSQADSQPLLIC
jgi:hypothetical protein